MSYGFIMGFSLACTQLGVSLRASAMFRLSAEGPLTLQDISLDNPQSGPLRLLVYYLVRKAGIYNLFLRLVLPIILDLSVGFFFGQLSKQNLREMARLLNRHLKDPDKEPYKRKALSLVVCCFAAPGISILVYVREMTTISELIFLLIYFYLLQAQNGVYAACVSTALFLFDANYFPLVIFTTVFCLAWVFPASVDSARRNRNYIFMATGRLLFLLFLQIIVIGAALLPFALAIDNPMASFTNKLHAMMLSGPNSLTCKDSPISLPSFWTILLTIKGLAPGLFDGITEYLEQKVLWIWSVFTLVTLLITSFPVMRSHMQSYTGVHRIFSVISCFTVLTSFVIFVPGRSCTAITPMLVAVYYIFLDIIATPSQAVMQKGFECTVVAERTHVGLLPMIIQSKSLQQRQLTVKCRCVKTNLCLLQIVGMIPTNIISIKQTPFVCLEKDTPCFDESLNHPLFQKRLKNYNSLRCRSLPQPLIDNATKMMKHPFNDLFMSNGLDGYNSIFRSLTLRERQKKGVHTSLHTNKDLHDDESLTASEGIFGHFVRSRSQSGIHFKTGISGSQLSEFLEEYKDRVSYLIPSIFIMLFSLCNMYTSIQNQGILRYYSQIFNLASFLALRRACKGHEKILLWSVPFLLIDILGLETLLSNKGTQVIIALFLVLCSTALLAFIAFGDPAL